MLRRVIESVAKDRRITESGSKVGGDDDGDGGGGIFLSNPGAMVNVGPIH